MIEIAHRGYSDLYKDNSRQSFMSSVLHQFDMIELDIQLTKDNKIIIYHNTFIENSLICNLDYKEILELDKEIMVLEEFLSLIDISKIRIYLDIKGKNLEIVNLLNNLLKNNPYIYNIFFASFHLIIISELHKINPFFQLGFITENMFPVEIFLMIIKTNNLKFISFHWTMLESSVIDFLHCNNVMVFTYTSKNKEILSFMEKYDVDGIVTNGKLSDYRQNIDLKNKKSKKPNVSFIIFYCIVFILLCFFQIKNYFIKE